MAETIRAISWNVNGIRAAHKKGFVDWLGQTNPDIMCLQETKAHLDQLPAALKEIEGYHSFFSTPERKGIVAREPGDSVGHWLSGHGMDGRLGL